MDRGNHEGIAPTNHAYLDMHGFCPDRMTGKASMLAPTQLSTSNKVLEPYSNPACNPTVK